MNALLTSETELKIREMPARQLDALGWQLIEQVCNIGWSVEVYALMGWTCQMKDTHGHHHTAQADTAPLAICLAALKAVGA